MEINDHCCERFQWKQWTRVPYLHLGPFGLYQIMSHEYTGVISVNRYSHEASVVFGPWSALSNEQDLKSNYCYIAINFNLLFSFAVTVRPRPWHLPNLQVTGLSGRPQQLFDPELAAMFPEMSPWKSGLAASILLNQWKAVQIAKLRVLHFF